MLEEDLTHYRDQPDRLIEEFKKLKTAKRKAEQFAIEAKQSAQKVRMYADGDYVKCNVTVHAEMYIYGRGVQKLRN